MGQAPVAAVFGAGLTTPSDKRLLGAQQMWRVAKCRQEWFKAKFSSA